MSVTTTSTESSMCYISYSPPFLNISSITKQNVKNIHFPETNRTIERRVKFHERPDVSSSLLPKLIRTVVDETDD